MLVRLRRASIFVSLFLFPPFNNIPVSVKSPARFLTQSGLTPRSFGTGHSDSGTSFSATVGVRVGVLGNSPHRGPDSHMPLNPRFAKFTKFPLHSRQTAHGCPAIFGYPPNFA